MPSTSMNRAACAAGSASVVILLAAMTVALLVALPPATALAVQSGDGPPAPGDAPAPRADRPDPLPAPDDSGAGDRLLPPLGPASAPAPAGEPGTPAEPDHPDDFEHHGSTRVGAPWAGLSYTVELMYFGTSGGGGDFLGTALSIAGLEVGAYLNDRASMFVAGGWHLNYLTVDGTLAGGQSLNPSSWGQSAQFELGAAMFRGNGMVLQFFGVLRLEHWWHDVAADGDPLIGNDGRFALSAGFGLRTLAEGTMFASMVNMLVRPTFFVLFDLSAGTRDVTIGADVFGLITLFVMLLSAAGD